MASIMTRPSISSKILGLFKKPVDPDVTLLKFKMERGLLAKELLAEKKWLIVLAPILSKVRSECYRQMTIPATNKDVLTGRLEVCDRIEAELRQAIKDGDDAIKTLTEIEEKKKNVR